MGVQNVKVNTIDRFWGSYLKTRPYGHGHQREYIYHRYRKFVKDPAACAVALVQEPFEIMKNKRCIKFLFGGVVFDYFQILDRINGSDKSILKNGDGNHNMMILYLINVEYLLFHANLPQSEIVKKIKPRAPYIVKVLKLCCAVDVVRSVEDAIFAIQHPRLFSKYEKMFNVDREEYFNSEISAKKELKDLLLQNGITARVQSRTKSIASLHEKICKKNVLPSQILDLIGLRVLVKNNDDCYRVLEMLSTHWVIQHARVKDYIAVPKGNGYQSIHVSGEFDGRSIEIQIRTYKMHHEAQYGQAAHCRYKREK